MEKELTYNRIYAYTTDEVKSTPWTMGRKGRGLIKVGQTSNLTSTDRVKQQLQGSPLILINGSYEILLDIEAKRNDGSYFKDKDVHRVLKVMKVGRIKDTEWFECTLEEVEHALSILKSGGSARNIESKFKSTTKSRGIKADQEQAKLEKKRIKDAHNILHVMKHYKEATSNVPIAKCLIEYLQIRQYSVSTVSVIIGPIINRLKEEGVLVNNGTQHNPILNVVNNVSFTTQEEIKKSHFSTSNIVPFLETKLYGATIQDFRNYFNIVEGNSALHEKIARRAKKINIRNKEGRVISRFFSPYKEIKVPKDEIIVEECKNNQREKRKAEDIKRLLEQPLKQMYGRVLVSSIFKEWRDLSTLETVLARFYPKYELVEKEDKLYIYYKKYNLKTANARSKQREELENLTQRASDFVRKNVRAKVLDLRSEFGLSESGAYSLMKEVARSNPDVFLIKDRRKGDRTAVLYLTTECTASSKIMSMLPDRVRWRLSAQAIDEVTFINIIKNNPGISNSQICELLRATYGQTFVSEVSTMIKVLLKEDLIANIGKGESRKLYIQDGSYESTISFKVPIEDIMSIIKRNEGCTIRELYNLLKPPYHIATLYNKLKNQEGLCLRKIYSLSSKKECYRVFSSKEKVVLSNDEVDLELIG